MYSRTRDQATRIFRVFQLAKDKFPTDKIADAAASLVGVTGLLSKIDKEWSHLSQYTYQHAACVLAAFPPDSTKRADMAQPLDELSRCIERIKVECSARADRSQIKKLGSAGEDAEVIDSLRKELDDALGFFKLNLDLKHKTNMETYLASVDIDKLLQVMVNVKHEIANIVPSLATKTLLETLPYAIGASWDPDKVCFPGTRDEMLDKMWNFIHAADGASCAQIFWLVDVAGSGKTAIANSLCKRAKDAGLLVMSFFFDHMSAERNNASKLVTTMARDLAALDNRIAKSMASVLERDVSLRSASITRQFDELIAQPSVKALGDRQQPYVFFLDALDEGLNPDEKLMPILSSGVRSLPGNFRIVVSSRPIAEIAYAFNNADHVQKHMINLRGLGNHVDITTYMHHLGMDLVQFSLVQFKTVCCFGNILVRVWFKVRFGFELVLNWF